MKRNTTHHRGQSGHRNEISSECQHIRAGWSRSERERRAGLATVRQFALWESISLSPEVVVADRRSTTSSTSAMSFG